MKHESQIIKEEHDGSLYAKKVTEVTTRAGEDFYRDLQKTEQRYSYQALASLVTLTVKSGSGFLHSVTIGNYSTPTIEIYDSLLASGPLVGRLCAGLAPGTYTYNTSFATGLTMNPQPGTSILPMITVSYR